nr:hypothetical protein [Tanacetum cinerariifolium]
MIQQYIICKRLCIRVLDMHGAILKKSDIVRELDLIRLGFGMMDVAFYVGSEESSGLLYGLATEFWNFGRDILRDIFGCNSLLKMDVAFYVGSEESSGLLYGLGTELWNFGRDILRDIFGCNLLLKNQGFLVWTVLGFTREIEFQKDLVIVDFESFIGSFVEENSSGVENFLCGIV